MTGGSLLFLRNLEAWYTPGRPVLSRFSLELAEGEVVGLIGLNGAGKTTLLKTLAGLLAGFRLERGLWRGKPFAQAPPRTFRETAFKRNRLVVFAEERAFPYFTFREYLAYLAASYGVPGLDISRPEVARLVEGFHFEAYTRVLLKELSTGNRKKASLIAAFALGTPLLLLDEPVNGLDFQSTEFLYQLMGEYRQRGTILFSSHILESLCLTSDRVMVLEEGGIRRTFTGPEIAAGNMREVLSFGENH